MVTETYTRDAAGNLIVTSPEGIQVTYGPDNEVISSKTPAQVALESQIYEATRPDIYGPDLTGSTSQAGISEQIRSGVEEQAREALAGETPQSFTIETPGAAFTASSGITPNALAGATGSVIPKGYQMDLSGNIVPTPEEFTIPTPGGSNVFNPSGVFKFTATPVGSATEGGFLWQTPWGEVASTPERLQSEIGRQMDISPGGSLYNLGVQGSELLKQDSLITERALNWETGMAYGLYHPLETGANLLSEAFPLFGESREQIQLNMWEQRKDWTAQMLEEGPIAGIGSETALLGGELLLATAGGPILGAVGSKLPILESVLPVVELGLGIEIATTGVIKAEKGIEEKNTQEFYGGALETGMGLYGIGAGIKGITEPEVEIIKKVSPEGEESTFLTELSITPLGMGKTYPLVGVGEGTVFLGSLPEAPNPLDLTPGTQILWTGTGGVTKDIFVENNPFLEATWRDIFNERLSIAIQGRSIKSPIISGLGTDIEGMTDEEFSKILEISSEHTVALKELRFWYGSESTTPFMEEGGLGRPIHDIDMQLLTGEKTAVGIREEFLTELNKISPIEWSINPEEPAALLKGGNKLLDIHSLESGLEGGTAEGVGGYKYLDLSKKIPEGIKVMELGSTEMRKGGAGLIPTVGEEGNWMFSAETGREKHVGDFFAIGEQLFKGSPETLARLGNLKELYGEVGIDVSPAGLPLDIGVSSPSLFPSSPLAFVNAAPSPILSTGPSLNDMLSSSPISEISSPSPSLSDMLSPSPISTSPSASPSLSDMLSPSPISEISSPSISDIFSLSPSPSLSLSPSLSPSISPSLSPSLSPSPSIIGGGDLFGPGPSLGGDGELFGGGSDLGFRRKFKWTPSFTAIVENIHGKRRKLITGLELRPLD